ncbi:MAG: 50S ribosomal protein L18 [Candidatus Saganbacteria bacterium]|nr:50S ribosomal protein L18 [Candidatus Saganbacteria bacterium]
MRKKNILGSAERPRLAARRALKNISAQLIDDAAGRTLAAASTVGKKAVKQGGNIAAAKVIGKLIAERALAKGIKRVVFDRGASLYHGRIKALAEAAREGGLEF